MKRPLLRFVQACNTPDSSMKHFTNDIGIDYRDSSLSFISFPTGLCGMRRRWARAPSQAYFISSIEGVPRRSVIKLSCDGKTRGKMASITMSSCSHPKCQQNTATKMQPKPKQITFNCNDIIIVGMRTWQFFFSNCRIFFFNLDSDCMTIMNLSNYLKTGWQWMHGLVRGL